MDSLPRLSFPMSKWYVELHSEACVCGLEESKGMVAVAHSEKTGNITW